MPKFKIGDAVWVARFDSNRHTKVPCSVCYGERKVILTLGNGDRVELPCDYCGKGNMGVPTGTQVEYHPSSEPEVIVIDGIEIKVSESGEKTDYRDGCHIYYEDNMFATREEAKSRGEELMAMWVREQEERSDYIKKDTCKSFAWNAGYHMREVKKAEKDIEYHSKKAVLCKKRVPKKGRGK